MADLNAQQATENTAEGATRELARWIATVRPDEIGAVPRAWAVDAILDWFAVTLPGSREPLSHILVESLVEEGEGPVQLVGRSKKFSALNAALANGAASHALDYDDVNSRMMGHPTVPLVPVLLSIAGTRKVSGKDFVEAFVIGYEAEVMAAEMVGLSHYDRGWHMTATLGTLGAAAAASRLLGLDPEQTAHALGLAVAQAAGLKSMFGTMSKPFQVGKAAQNGLLAARLAQRGMTSRTDAIECAQGLADTQSDGISPLGEFPGGNASFAVEENLFKYHAACYLTHSSIEAGVRIKTDHQIAPEQIERVVIEVDKGALSVCNIPRPETGLQIKFSLRHVVAMGLHGHDTADLEAYTDERALNPVLSDLAARTSVVGVEGDTRTFGTVSLDLKNGNRFAQTCDVGIPAADQAHQRARLLAKFNALSKPVLGEERSDALVQAILTLESLEDASELTALSLPA